jgi:non-ribosomal peptide synthetase component F
MFLDAFFEKAAFRYPDAVAIEQGENIYSYKQVDRTANKLAQFLRTKGIGPEDKVVILLPRCAFVPIAMLGVLKAGAAYIPLDPEIPADRVSFIMEDSGAKLIISSDSILQRIGSELASQPVFNIDTQLNETDGFPDTKPDETGRSLPIYVISFTLRAPQESLKVYCSNTGMYPITSAGHNRSIPLIILSEHYRDSPYLLMHR